MAEAELEIFYVAVRCLVCGIRCAECEASHVRWSRKEGFAEYKEQTGMLLPIENDEVL